MSQLLSWWVSRLARACVTMLDRWSWFTFCSKCESVYAIYDNSGTNDIPMDPCNKDPLDVFDDVNATVNVMRFVYILWLKRQPHSFDKYLNMRESRFKLWRDCVYKLWVL